MWIEEFVRQTRDDWTGLCERAEVFLACLLRAHRLKLLQDDNAMLRDNIKREQQAREDIARLMREECGSMAARLREEVRGGARVYACVHVTFRRQGYRDDTQ